MNAINHTEAQAIDATASAAPAVLLEAADPTKIRFLCRWRGWYRAPRAATCARPRACRFLNSPPASSVSACCKT